MKWKQQSIVHETMLQYFRDTVVLSIISVRKPVDIHDDFVKYYYNNGGMQLDQFINKYYLLIP